MLLLFFFGRQAFAQTDTQPRETILLNKDWAFAFGHPTNPSQDFGHDTAYFSYLAKTGNGDGPASPTFNDAPWRRLDLPHDWAAEQPFDPKGSPSHGYKASGRGFPEKSIGWYRKTLLVPQSDLGKVITLKFEGVFRDSKVWFNGFYLGGQESGYQSFEFDVSAYVNYGAENTIAVRVDASQQEGWFYEGAGIYRNVYLQKTGSVFIPGDGLRVTSELKNNKAIVNITASVASQTKASGKISIRHELRDAEGKMVGQSGVTLKTPPRFGQRSSNATLSVKSPKLWHPDHPYLYMLTTIIEKDGRALDRVETNIGIRSLHFDAKSGFYINGEPLKLKGTNNHQNHAGVGTAIPQGLEEYRISRLKEMGCNACRASHYPPSPAFLEACDRLGMLVIDETRLMGTSPVHLEALKKLIARDFNHPSVFLWSVGNEEWMIEGNVKGERIARTMQNFVKTLDPGRRVVCGLSSGFQSGISSVIDVIGYNYLGNGDIDAHHKDFPDQPGLGTEEGSTFATRGVYFEEPGQQYKKAYDHKPRPTFYSIEEGWKFYNERPWLAGMFVWTGFDYPGEPTPFGWPSVSSYFGMMDRCGFPKDSFYYLKTWWNPEPELHLFPHWNWKGKEGEEIPVWVYANCEQVELFVNGLSLGKQAVAKNGHLEWQVKYAPGDLRAVGYTNGKQVAYRIHQTTFEPSHLLLSPRVFGKSKNIAIVEVGVADASGRPVPTASTGLEFSVTNAKILGVGNGDPVSHEPEKFVDTFDFVPLTDVQYRKPGSNSVESSEEVWSQWSAYQEFRDATRFRMKFDAEKVASSQFAFFSKIPGTRLWLNGQVVVQDKETPGVFHFASVAAGKNVLEIEVPQVQSAYTGFLGMLRRFEPASVWKRKLFNGKAQVILEILNPGAELRVTGEGVGEKTVRF